ncbi:hypothetical protein niasHS_006363 [Heterodera schachtii]|uniref:Uncharacterized protein n=1 Tax=Heterodera schachtii TaxID=97005 RepID=A0ABD2JWJ3_HETSC
MSPAATLYAFKHVFAGLVGFTGASARYGGPFVTLSELKICLANYNANRLMRECVQIVVACCDAPVSTAFDIEGLSWVLNANQAQLPLIVSLVDELLFTSFVF